MDANTRTALRKADEIRRKLGLKMFQPVNIFDICQRLDIDVRFIDVSMEGLYASDGNKPTILLSALRPLPRRYFTCAHELGHHVFGHGNRLDALYDTENFSDDEEELLVNIFAGALLMPTGGIQSQFTKRGWDIKKGTPLQFCTIASAFGTGYSTLITHCIVNNLISRSFADKLLRVKPASILKQILGNVGKSSYFKIVDSYSNLSVIDLEVSNFLIVPKASLIEDNHFELVLSTKAQEVFLAVRPGITRITEGVNAFLRVQKEKYIGLAEYRHLEN